ncbi:HYC_CC_PP family protein [Winogradskyella endarachnes]|uniref:Uncharacterized protein n=1 Tax=Winogradskyella endarachnes TaxID=2681965 RepID=A0A6L6U6V1_9FLAO|nr:hypothetical protein [Winogradskyella endarachnes]MUU77990.1 hypothetical protein [Winogradskyella endarachnes]
MVKYSNTHKVFAFALSFLILISSLSLSIEKHFCGDTLVDVSIFTEADTCCGGDAKASEVSIVKKSCCKNEVDVIDGLSVITINSFEDLDITQQHILFAFSFSYLSLFEDIPKAIIPHKEYSPPKLIKDIHVLDETFLI